jgi:hypothetical protein
MIDEETLQRAAVYVRHRYGSDLTYMSWIEKMAQKLKVSNEYLLEYIADKEEGYA